MSQAQGSCTAGDAARTRFILYVVRTSPSPDHCEGAVPWRVDEAEIFFGPCKKRLRRALRERFLGPDRPYAELAGRERVIVAGINAGRGSVPRKIIWAGELLSVMSFAEAWVRLDHPRYAQMRNARASPLHLIPTRTHGRLVGYTHHGLEHAAEDRKRPGEFAWWDDLVPRPMRTRRIAAATPTTLTLQRDVDWWDGFPLDACLLLRNRFWADGAGLPFDDDALRLLRDAQPDTVGVDAAAAFGRDRRGYLNGKRGTYLEVGGRLGDAFAAWIDGHAGVRVGSGERAAGTRTRSC